MSATGTIRLVWANGEDDFCIAKVGEIFALEEKCNAGIGAIAQRLEGGGYYLNDIRETIRLGLIGGGMSAEKAMTAVKLHVDGAPLQGTFLLAYHIIAAALTGVSGDDVGKKAEAEAVSAFTEKTDASADQPSSGSAPASDGRRAKRTRSRSGNSARQSTVTTRPTVQSLLLSP